MWRGYGNVGNKNDGVAIGFKFEDLQSISENLINKVSGFSKPQECVYDPNSLQTRLREAFGASLEKATDFPRVEKFLKESMPLEKDIHFECEKEWRMFYSNGVSSIDMKRGLVTEVGGTHRRHFRLPYIQSDHDSGTMAFPMGIREIMAGPNTNHEKLEVFCNTVFCLNNCDYPEISQSKIPFV